MTRYTARIVKDNEYGESARPGQGRVERTRWRIDFSNGRHSFTSTRYEALDVCERMGVEVVTAASDRP